MAETRKTPLPGGTVSMGTQVYAEARPHNRMRESDTAPVPAEPRTQRCTAENWTMTEQSAKKVD